MPGYMALVAEGRFSDAFSVNREANLFPAFLCLVCPRPCESVCRRGLIDEPVAIRHLKRAAVEYGGQQITQAKKLPEESGKRVAIVGSGPAGMAAVLTLREEGHAVAVYEAETPGGMLSKGIPSFRLPKQVVQDQWAALEETGVELHSPIHVGVDVSLDSLLADHDAVLLACGCQSPAWLNVPGRHLLNVHSGLGFMKRLASMKPAHPGERVILIGAGCVGLDCARSALRLGARSVTVIEILPESALTYDPEEREVAREEGISFAFATRVERIEGQGRVSGVTTVELDADGQPLEECERFLPADSVIIAVGLRVADTFLADLGLASVAEAARDTRLPHQPAAWPEKLFAAGDFLRGASSVPEAIEEGRQAAETIHHYLTGERPAPAAGGPVAPWTRETLERRLWAGDDYDRIPRQPIRHQRTPGEGQVCELSYSREAAQREAQRCLQCQLNLELDPQDCILCGRCVEICPYRCLNIVGRESIAGIDGDSEAPELEEARAWPDGAALVLDETLC
ncbi:MAG: FAD-dependent oxidoreductase, partial [Dehalococcoidia bacterium]